MYFKYKYIVLLNVSKAKFSDFIFLEMEFKLEDTFSDTKMPLKDVEVSFRGFTYI